MLPRPRPMRLGLEQQSALPCVTPWPPRAGPQRRRKKNGSRSRASARKARALLTGRCGVSALPARCLIRCLGVSIQSLFVVASEPPLHCLPSDSSSHRGSSRSSSSRQSGSAPAPAPAPLRPHRPGLAWQCACSEVPACGHGGLPCAALTHRSKLAVNSFCACLLQIFCCSCTELRLRLRLRLWLWLWISQGKLQHL